MESPDVNSLNILSSLFLYNYIYLFFGCAGSLFLRGLFSRSGEWGLLFSCGVQASHGVASLTAENRIWGSDFSSWGTYVQ